MGLDPGLGRSLARTLRGPAADLLERLEVRAILLADAPRRFNAKADHEAATEALGEHNDLLERRPGGRRVVLADHHRAGHPTASSGTAAMPALRPPATSGSTVSFTTANGDGISTERLNRYFAAAYEAAHEAVYNCLVAGRPARRLDGSMQEEFPLEAVRRAARARREAGLSRQGGG